MESEFSMITNTPYITHRPGAILNLHTPTLIKY